MAIVALISWMLACVSLIDGLQGRDPGRWPSCAPAMAFSYSSCGDLRCAVQPGHAPLLALLLPQVGPGLVELGLGSCRSWASREASSAFRSLCSMTARVSPFLTFMPSSTYIRSTRPGDLGADHRLIARFRDIPSR